MAVRVVIASDSFKGSLSSREVADAVSEGIAAICPECLTVRLSIADGGEGTASALTEVLGGVMTRTRTCDPLGREIGAEYGIISPLHGRKTAVIETAQASGLALIGCNERNPMITSTFGTGRLIADALEKGCRKFIIGMGGSATNDAGTGMLEALGFIFRDKHGRQLNGLCGGLLHEIHEADASCANPALAESEFIAAYDADTPFCGPEGAAAVFGPQKGATHEDVVSLDSGMQSFGKVIHRTFGMDISSEPGTGAAGGLGGAMKAFLGARLVKGIDMVLDTIGFEDIIKGADLIITGEGRIDSQTSKGKVISGITSRAGKAGIPVIAIAGIVDLDEECVRMNGLTAAFEIGPRPQDESGLEQAMRPETASRNISRTVAKALTELFPSLFPVNP